MYTVNENDRIVDWQCSVNSTVMLWNTSSKFRILKRVAADLTSVKTKSKLVFPAINVLWQEGMFECIYFLSLLALQSMDPLRNAVCTASLNSRKRGSTWCWNACGTPAQCGRGSQKDCFHFYFFTVLKNSCVKGYSFFPWFFITMLFPRCPPLFHVSYPRLPGLWLCIGVYVGEAAHVDNLPHSMFTPWVHVLQLWTGECWMLWMC